MADQIPNETTRMNGGDSPEINERRDFMKRAALLGLPVVLATVSSRTAWARPSANRQKYPTPKKDVSAGGSVAPSGGGSLSKIFDTQSDADRRRSGN